MTTTQATGAFLHELVLHDGAAELVALMAPFVRDGAAAGEHVVVLGEPDFVETLLAAVPDAPAVQAVPRPLRERSPGRELHLAQQLLARLDESPSDVRLVNQMPPVDGVPWHEWRRYEAAANLVLAPYRGWGKCAHDTRTLQPGMLTDLLTTHPFVQAPDRPRRSAEFEHVDTRTRTFLDTPRHPVESTEPTVSIVEPTAAAARRAVRDIAMSSQLSPTAQESLILATSEAVTNARAHGRPPVLLRVWASRARRLTVSVSDAGPGPDPLVGLVPDVSDGAGRGMWITHLLLREIHHRRSADGYTITFSADGP